MKKLRKCIQPNCDEPVAYRYTWPGQDEAGICAWHVSWLFRVAQAMGLYLQLLPVVQPPAVAEEGKA